MPGTMTSIMARRSRLKLPSLSEGEESLGQRISRLRKERGFTQVELAEKMGIIQALVSDYERDKLRPHAEMVVRFAVALDVTTDEILGQTPPHKAPPVRNRRFLRRLQQIDKLPKRDQEALLRTIDAFLGKTKAS
jgi:transcriptional regulator with XRE-family HTH domain